LIHVLDASHPRVYDFHATTMRVLDELGADTRRVVTLLNKVDRVEDSSSLHALRLHFPDAVFGSAHTGQGKGELLHLCGEMLREWVTKVELALPLSRTELLSLLHRTSRVLSLNYDDRYANVVAMVSPKVFARVEPFLVRREATVQGA